MRKIISNRLTFSNRLMTPPPAGCDRPDQLQTPPQDVRRTARQIEYTKVARDFDGVSNRLTFSKCLTTASPAGCDLPKQLQTPREDGRRTARRIEYTKMAREFDGVSNRLTFSKCLTPESPPTDAVVPLSVLTSKVYARRMTRINVNIDDQACAEIMRRYRLSTKGDAINLALRMLAAETASVDEARSLRGIGWEGDLDAMRSNRAP